jgi:hypothetical protein
VFDKPSKENSEGIRTHDGKTIRMHSPLLDIPMRLEIPLRAVIRGGPALYGTYSVYLHALLADDGTEFVYYGITKRGWNLRFAEHTKSAGPCVYRRESQSTPRRWRLCGSFGGVQRALSAGASERRRK